MGNTLYYRRKRITKAGEKAKLRILEEAKNQGNNLWFCKVADLVKWDKYCKKYLEPTERLQLAKEVYKECGFDLEAETRKWLYKDDAGMYDHYFRGKN